MIKKLTLVLIVTTLLCISFSGITTEFAHAEVSFKECDEVFISTIQELLDSQNANNTDIQADKILLYDMNIQPLGFLYEFKGNDNSGFAVVIENDKKYECVEIYFDAQNPYGKPEDNTYPVYADTMKYLNYNGDKYCDALSGNELSQSTIETLKTKSYKSSGESLDVTKETINYTYKSKDKHNLAFSIPSIYASVNDKSNCVPIMGANIIQFYDRYCTELIPNYTPGRPIGTLYRYNAPSNETASVVNILAQKMGTTSIGTSIDQFEEGMKKYCQEKGYTFAYTSCMNNKQFDYSVAKQQLKSNRPIALFVEPYTIETIEESENYDNIGHSFMSGTHSMAVFGYLDITYTLTNGQKRTDSYLQVATGNSSIKNGYCKLSNNTTIDEALSISIT